MLKKYIASGAIVPFQFVKFDSVAGKITQSLTAHQNIIGIAIATKGADTNYAAGDEVEVALSGIYKIKASQAFPAGSFVATTATGTALKTVNAPLAEDSTHVIAAQLLQRAVATGDIVNCRIVNQPTISYGA